SRRRAAPRAGGRCGLPDDGRAIRILTPFGFFSIVRKPEHAAAGLPTVRARVAADLDALRREALPDPGPTEAHTGTDYPFRARAPQAAVARAIGALVAGIDYANFKDAVAARQGPARAEVYHGVWSALRRLENR
ncbi:MAG: hypothetical protein ACK4ST_14950, partial [Elioraea tepidiphila]